MTDLTTVTNDVVEAFTSNPTKNAEAIIDTYRAEHPDVQEALLLMALERAAPIIEANGKKQLAAANVALAELERRQAMKR